MKTVLKYVSKALGRALKTIDLLSVKYEAGEEMLHIIHNGDIRMISAGFDQPLKDTSEHLEYIWTDQ